MAVQKLSQIALAGSPPALTDTVVGVGGGTTDFQYTLAQIQNTVGGLIAATQNLNFYISTTGNDSNDGLTVGTAFATIQRALDIAVQYNYGGLYNVTINVGAGTFTSSIIHLPALVNVPTDQNPPTIVGAGQSTIITGSATEFYAGSGSTWSIQNLTIDTFGTAIWARYGGVIIVVGIWLDDSSGIGGQTCFESDDSAFISVSSVTLLMTQILQLIECNNGGVLNMGGTLTFPVSFAVSGGVVIFGDAGANIGWFPSPIINGGGVTGATFGLQSSSSVQSNNGVLSDFVGSTVGTVDGTCSIANFNNEGNHFANIKSGVPVTTDICSGSGALWKDTSGGGVYVAYNDAGTIKGLSLPSGLTNQIAFLNVADQTVSGGANITSDSLTTGNVTIDCGARPLQFITNGGAFTITAPASDGSCMLLVTNNASAGTITFSGFSVGTNKGDALDTTNTHKFTISIWRINSISGYRVAAHQ